MPVVFHPLSLSQTHPLSHARTRPVFPLQVWAVRENITELAFRTPTSSLTAPIYYNLTGLLVAAAYALSVVVPSVWLLVSLVGSTACVTFSYIFPGLLVRRDPQLWRRVAGLGTVGLGVVMAVVAVFNTLSGHASL